MEGDDEVGKKKGGGQTNLHSLLRATPSNGLLCVELNGSMQTNVGAIEVKGLYGDSGEPIGEAWSMQNERSPGCVSAERGGSGERKRRYRPHSD